jgi:hypothetical protein
MAATVPSAASFLVNFPEFSKAPLALVNAKLAEAARRTHPLIYVDDTTAQDAVFLRAAVLLSLSPYARQMKLVDDTAAMVWSAQLYEMQRSATMGLRVF